MKWFPVLISIFFATNLVSQDLDAHSSKYGVGILMGTGSQKNFPFAGRDYRYQSNSYRLQLERSLWKKGSWNYVLILEPGIFKVDHQLLNKFFIKPTDVDFEARRQRFLQPRTFYEYALNLGLKARKQVISEKWYLYALGSTGPMYGTESTERLKRGLAFANILGLGSEFKLWDDLFLDTRISIRHTSNAGTKRPNSGHNSLLFEGGLNYRL
ncbi:MAG: acyloxyacyl hydrolase [Nonlabens sp.]